MSLSIVRYHLVPGGRLFTAVIKDGLTAQTMLDGTSLRFGVVSKGGGESSSPDMVTVNGALIEPEGRDLRASNGAVHFLDEMLFPLPSASLFELLDSDGRFVTMTRALEVAGLAEALGSANNSSSSSSTTPITVFAPTDEAFDRVPQR